MTENAHLITTPWASPPETGSAVEVAPGVFWVRLPLPMKLDHVNAYVLDDGHSWTIVDTGMGSDKTRQIWRDLLDGVFSHKPVGRLIITHHHPDHIGLAGWFQSEFNAELWTTRTAWLMARMLCLDVQKTPLPETLQFWRRSGMAQDMIDERASGNPFNFADVVHPMPLGFYRIQQENVIEIGGRHWQVHIGHGHAPEHATLWNSSDNLVLAGDQIISSISPNLGVYATEPEADPVGDWFESCGRLAKLADPDQLVLSGHKLPFKGLPFRFQQMIENHHSALERLIEFLDQPKAAAECFQPLFKRRIGADEYGLALVEAVAHLNHLYLKGDATRRLDLDGVYRYHV
ncbi:MAG: MBL fold metallo-hydrolase [Paracoccaceae bacterium]